MNAIQATARSPFEFVHRLPTLTARANAQSKYEYYWLYDANKNLCNAWRWTLAAHRDRRYRQSSSGTSSWLW